MNPKTKDIEVESGYEKQERLRKEEEKRLKDLESRRTAKEIAEAETEARRLAGVKVKGTAASIGKDGKSVPSSSSSSSARSVQKDGKKGDAKDRNRKGKNDKNTGYDGTDIESNSDSDSGSDSGSGSGSGREDDAAASANHSRSPTTAPANNNTSRSVSPVPVATSAAAVAASSNAPNPGASTSGSANPRSIYTEHTTAHTTLHKHPHKHHSHHKTHKIPDPIFLGCLILAPAEYMRCRNLATFPLHDRPVKKIHNISVGVAKSSVSVGNATGTERASSPLSVTGLPALLQGPCAEYPLITISFNVETVVQWQKELKEKEEILKKLKQQEDDAADEAEETSVDLFVQQFEKDTETDKFPHNGLILSGKTKGNIMANEDNIDGLDGKHVDYNFKGIRFVSMRAYGCLCVDLLL